MKVIKKLTKDAKTRMELYKTVKDALEGVGVEVLGKSKKGLVLKDGLVEIAVVVKKTPVTDYADLITVEEYEEERKAYLAEKAKEEAKDEDE